MKLRDTKKTDNANPRKPKQKFRVLRSGIQGQGAFATTRIRKGTRIIEYTGELISPEEEARRYDGNGIDRHHTFLFAIDEKVTIDATRRGGVAKYINHSCDPNCEAVNERDRIFIEAIKNIQPGVELTYDYGFEHDGEPLTELRALYPCHCGADNCRGTIVKVRTKRKKK
jgi:hypothetical protein